MVKCTQQHIHKLQVNMYKNTKNYLYTTIQLYVV